MFVCWFYHVISDCARIVNMFVHTGIPYCTRSSAHPPLHFALWYPIVTHWLVCSITRQVLRLRPKSNIKHVLHWTMFLTRDWWMVSVYTFILYYALLNTVITVATSIFCYDILRMCMRMV